MTATLTLTNGQAYSKTWAKVPKNWKSALLRQLPYGADVQGAAFSITL